MFVPVLQPDQPLLPQPANTHRTAELVLQQVSRLQPRTALNLRRLGQDELLCYVRKGLLEVSFQTQKQKFKLVKDSLQ